MSADNSTLSKLNRKIFGLSAHSKRPLVCVQGLGFVGAAMSVATAFASDDKGEKIFDVLGVDIPSTQGKARVESIKNGKFPFASGDEKLDQATMICHREKNLAATTDARAFSLADIVVIDVNLDVDFTKNPPVAIFEKYIAAIKTLGKFINPNTLIIVETTVPPGTCERVVLPTLKEVFRERGLSTEKILLAHSYERVMPGPNYLNSVINYWRVYAGNCKESAELCEAFLEQIIDTDNFPLRRLSSTTASETAKILENTYRATNIALIDEWGVFAEKIGVDLFEIIDAIRDRPTHSNIRQPGFGVGGYCLTKDPSFGIIANNSFFKKENVKFPFAELAMATNNQMPLRNLNHILSFTKKKPCELKILMLGIAYRSEVDDTRFSASETFYKEALRMGIKIQVQDPHVDFWTEIGIPVQRTLPPVNGIDIVVFCVPHKFYRSINFETWLIDHDSIIYDCDNVLTKKQIDQINSRGITFAKTGSGII